MQIKKENINVGKAVFSGDIKSSAEGSIIVPDVKPDILKVIQVDAESFLEEKTVENGKLILKGKVCLNILYIPENENQHVQCLKGNLEFCETVKKAELEQGMDITATCDIGKVGYKLINSRKIGFESQVIINVSVTSEERISFVYDIESDKAEVITDNLCIKESLRQKEFTFSIEDSLDLTNNSIIEILKGNVVISEKDCRSITGKLVVKGKASATVLYVTETGNYEHIDFEMPFTEVLDWENVYETCECELNYEITEAEFTLESLDENKKCLKSNVNIRVTAYIENFINAKYIKDCYFTNSLCTIDFTNVIYEEVCAKPMFSTMVKHIIEKNENLPDISGIYTSVAKPYITSTDIQNGRIAVSGKISVCILYMSDDSQIPLSGLSEELPFSHVIDCDEASSDIDVLLKIECEHISCTMNSVNTIEVRCGICIKGKVVKKQDFKVIKDVTIQEDNIKDKSMIVYFTKKDDTIWNIGKKYRVRCQDIRDCNNLEGEELDMGKKIIIPVS